MTEHELTARKIRIGAFVLLVVLFFVLAGCVKRAETDSAVDMAVYTDNLTGCQYIGWEAGNTITPRLNRDGKQICREVQP